MKRFLKGLAPLTLSLLAIRWGSHLTLIPNPRDFGKFVETLKKRPFHVLPAVKPAGEVA